MTGGYYYLEETKRCEHCEERCLFCKNSFECDVCKEGYFELNGSCSKCEVDNCVDCIGFENCTKCKKGFFIKDGLCSKC